MFNLIYASPYTVYPVGTYDSVEAAERDCEDRYRVKGFKFKRGIDNVLQQTIFEECEVSLRLYEVGVDAT